MDRLDEAARAIVDLFEQRNVPYALMGGFAVRIHALPRPTYDVDFTIGVRRSDLAPLYEDVERLGFTIPSVYLSGWVDQVGGLPLVKFKFFAQGKSIDIDIFLAETRFQESVLQRRERHGQDGWEAWFASAEDLVLLKLIADRPRDRIDIADILFIQGRLDEAYLRKWARELNIEDRLDRALADGGKSSRG